MKKKNKILVYGPVGVDPFKLLPEHTGKEPFIHLKNYFENNGLEISLFSEEFLSDTSWVFFWDIPSAFLSSNCRYNSILELLRFIATSLRTRKKKSEFEKIIELCLKYGLKDRLALILWEPPAVLPQNYNKKLHSKFKYIFTWDDALVDNLKYIKYYWPQNGNDPIFFNKKFADRKLVVNISGNKKSPHPDALYSSRNNFIRYCEIAIPKEFDLFGPGWSSDSSGKDYPSWKGVIHSKSDIYSNYKFGLVYENMKNIEGWVSEKIFDCIRCGCVPIYWGASNIQNYVDPQSFVDRRMFKDEKELINYLLSLTEESWLAMRNAGAEYIKSNAFAKFLPSNFSEIIGKKLIN